MNIPRHLLIITSLLFACPAVLRAQDTPAGEGERLYLTACVQCHGLQPIELTRDGKSGWEDTVQKMVVIGAQLSPAEMATLTDYLATRFGPASGDPMRTGALPPDAPLAAADRGADAHVSLPEGPGAQLVGAYCTMCHDAGRIVANRRSEEDWRRYTVNMLAQGDMTVSADNLELMVDYLTDKFGEADSGSLR